VADYAGIDPGNIDVLPFGVNLNTFKTIRAATVRERADPYRVGFFKGFREVYGPTYLIQAIPLVLAQIPNTRFEMVGDGAQLVLSQEMASNLGVSSSIDWIPRQPHRELPNLISRWDVTVIPSVQEAFGVAALESSAMEVPVVASDVCGLRDTVLDGQTGVLVPPRSPEAIADALIMILQDADLRQRMGRAGREKVQSEYDWRDLHDRWIKFYEQVRAGVAQPPSAGPQGTAEGRCATKPRTRSFGCGGALSLGRSDVWNELPRSVVKQRSSRADIK
jgi:glycosyltransferase involved in cell wall biosynthesis